MLRNSYVQFKNQYNQANQHRLLRNRGPLYAPRFLWCRFAPFTTKTAALRSAAVGKRYIFAASIARKVNVLCKLSAMA